jgi:hypothetical protein
MWQYAVKVVLTAVVVVAVVELGKRSSLWAAVLASLPLTSLLAFVWLYLDTGSSEAVATLSGSIFWLVLPSLPLFLVLPVLLRASVPFWLGLGIACAITVVAYFAMVFALERFHVRL